MAGEISIAGSIGNKIGATIAALPLGTETVEATIGTDDVLIVIRDGLIGPIGNMQVENLVKQLLEALDEAGYVEPA